MNNLHIRKFLILLLLTALLLGSCKCALFSRSQTRATEKHMAGSKRSSPKMKESPKVMRAKKEQEKKQEKQDRGYDKFVKQSRKRSYQIQSDDVKARMKQNESDRKIRERSKAKKARHETKKAGKKYN